MTGRGLRGRRLARLMLFAAVALDVLLVLLLYGWAPNTMGGPMFDYPPPHVWLISAVGVALNLAGLAWMIRIVRADPEAHPSWWRAFRD